MSYPVEGDRYRQKQRVKREKGPDRQNWMTSGEFAKYLGVSPRWFRRMQQKGTVPEPAARTDSGYGLWSPEQQAETLRKKTGIR